MMIAATRGRVGRVCSSNPTCSSVHNTLPEPGALSRSHGGPYARPTRTTISAIALVAALTLNSRAVADPEMEVVGTWGGEVRAVFIDEAVDPYLAYVGSGRNMVVLDVTDPANIVERGRIDLGNLVLDIKVRGDYAYVGTYAEPHQFCVVDVSDIADMHVAWSSDDFTGAPWEVEFHGDLVWFRWGTDLRRFNVSDPESPYWGGTAIWSIAETFTIVDDLMYVGVDDSGGWPELYVYDLGPDPVFPTFLGSGELEWAPHGFKPTALRVVGDYAYMTLQDGFLTIWDVSDPNAPVHIGDYDDFISGTWGLAVNDGVAYVVDGTLQLLDVTDPTLPTLLDSFETHGGVARVEVVGSRVYAMSPGEGLIILDVSTRSAPTRLGSWYSPADLRRMDKVGDVLYVSDRINGITFLDTSDPFQPALLGAYQTSEASGRWGDNWDIQVRDGLAYLAAGYGGIEIVDVNIPAQPELRGSYLFEPGLIARALELDGDFARVGVRGGGGGFLVNFDISNPQAIEDVGFVSLGSAPIAFSTGPNGYTHAAGGLGLGGGGGSVYAIDTNDALDPNLESSVLIAPGNSPKDVVVQGDVRYVTNWRTDGTGGLYMQDVSDPSNPLPPAGFIEADAASRVAVRNGVAYMTCYQAGERALLAVDVSDRRAPVPLGYVIVPGAWHVFLDGPYAYVTGGSGENRSTGLAVVKLDGIAAWGDLNCDGAIDFDDIDPFVAALSGQSGYEAQFPDCNWYHGDCNGDDAVNFDDIDAFVALLTAS